MKVKIFSWFNSIVILSIVKFEYNDYCDSKYFVIWS